MSRIPVFKKMDRYKAKNLQAFNTKWPNRYDSSLRMRLWTSQWDRGILTELPTDISSLRILDIGCATGRLLETLAEAGARHLAGIDLAPKILDIAQRRLAERGIKADLKVADAEDTLPWANESFDVIIMTGALHHFYRPMDALTEVHRVLCHRGRLIIIDPWFLPPLRQLFNLGLRFVSPNGDYHFYSPAEAVDMLASQGFVELRYRRADWNSFIVLGLKDKL